MSITSSKIYVYWQKVALATYEQPVEVETEKGSNSNSIISQIQDLGKKVILSELEFIYV